MMKYFVVGQRNDVYLSIFGKTNEDNSHYIVAMNTDYAEKRVKANSPLNPLFKDDVKHALQEYGYNSRKLALNLYNKYVEKQTFDDLYIVEIDNDLFNDDQYLFNKFSNSNMITLED